jgi:hypothetical protein
MRQLLMLSAIGALATVTSVGASEPAFVPVASIKQLHDTLISPASDALFNAESTPPKDAAGWNALGNNAIVLAESANLLMLKGRAKDDSKWMTFSRELLDAAVAAEGAAIARKQDALIAANGRIVEVCQSCHEPYRDGGHGMMMRK